MVLFYSYCTHTIVCQGYHSDRGVDRTDTTIQYPLSAWNYDIKVSDIINNRLQQILTQCFLLNLSICLIFHFSVTFGAATYIFNAQACTSLPAPQVFHIYTFRCKSLPSCDPHLFGDYAQTSNGSSNTQMLCTWEDLAVFFTKVPTTYMMRQDLLNHTYCLGAGNGFVI